MGTHEADGATEVAERMARNLAAGRCTNPQQPCPMHLTGARRQVDEVLAVIAADGWALRKVHLPAEQTVVEGVEDMALGDLRYPSRQVRLQSTRRSVAPTQEARPGGPGAHCQDP